MATTDIGKARKRPREGAASLAQRFMIYCAVALILVGAGCILFAVFLVTQWGADREMVLRLMDAGKNPVVAFFISNSEAVMLLTAGLFASTLGSSMMRRAISASAKTIPEADRLLLETLISDGNSKALAEYVRLASLTGVTGVFTKLGFTGLPLATAALGVFLLVLASFREGDTAADLMDLSKLVLGAFIGSFVQRKVERPESDAPSDPDRKPDLR